MFNGSEIAAIMGLSSYVTRAEMLRRKATGIEPEYDAATLDRFAEGHRCEALARPMAEEILEDDLSAMVMSDIFDGVLISVSLDGINQAYNTTWEHKSLNIKLADALDAG
jgi:predicted phage-related endonuclease